MRSNKEMKNFDKFTQKPVTAKNYSKNTCLTVESTLRMLMKEESRKFELEEVQSEDDINEFDK